jgi:hypothetical protein
VRRLFLLMCKTLGLGLGVFVWESESERRERESACVLMHAVCVCMCVCVCVCCVLSRQETQKAGQPRKAVPPFLSHSNPSSPLLLGIRDLTRTTDSVGGGSASAQKEGGQRMRGVSPLRRTAAIRDGAKRDVERGSGRTLFNVSLRRDGLSVTPSGEATDSGKIDFT